MALLTMNDLKDLSLAQLGPYASARGIGTAGKERVALAQEIVAHDHFAAMPVANHQAVTVNGERIVSNGQAHKLAIHAAEDAMAKALRW